MQFFIEGSTDGSQGGFAIDPMTIFLVVILGVFIIFMLRSSKKRKEQAAELRQKMVPGVRVMTNFGLYGQLISNDDEFEAAQLEIAPGVVIDVHKTTLSRVVEEAPNDAQGDDTSTDPELGDDPIERA